MSEGLRCSICGQSEVLHSRLSGCKGLFVGQIARGTDATEAKIAALQAQVDTLAARVRELEADILLLRADPACYYAQERDRVDRSGSPAERTP